MIFLQKVQDTLRNHSNAVREPTHVHPVSVSSYKTDNKTKNIWKKIYTNPNLLHEWVVSTAVFSVNAFTFTCTFPINQLYH